MHGQTIRREISGGDAGIRKAKTKRPLTQKVNAKSSKNTVGSQRKAIPACFAQTTTKAGHSTLAEGGNKISGQSSTVNKSAIKSQSEPKRNITCLLMNAQSIRSKFDEFVCYVDLEKPDIICVTETWVSESYNGDRLKDF